MTQQAIATVDRPDRSGVRSRPATVRPYTPRRGTAPRPSRQDRRAVPVDRMAAAGCRVVRPVEGAGGGVRSQAVRPQGSGEMQLTDRGIAVVLGLGAMLVLVALLCIGTTAVRVMSEPAPQSAGVQVSAPAAGAVGAGTSGVAR